MNKSIIVVNYGLPPNEGIGGRRWAKLSKGLANLGYHITVIAAQPEKNHLSPWIADISHPNINAKYLPKKYPSFISHSGNSFLDSIKFRLTILLLKFFEKGTVFDKAIFWKKQLSATLSEICNNESVNIIVSGAPFNLMYYVALLKEKGIIKMNLLVDFRDPWIGAENYGMAALNGRRAKVEFNKFITVCENADKIISPNEILSKELSIISKQKNVDESKFVTLNHFFDPDDVREENVDSNDKSAPILIIYGGTLYSGTELHLIELKNELDTIYRNDRGLYDRLRIEFYTLEIFHKKIFKDHPEVYFSKPIGKMIFERAALASGILLFYNNRNKNYPTSKIFEYLPYKKPFIVYCNGGLVGKYIIDHGWGIKITKKNSFIEVIKNIENGNLSFNTSSINSFSLTKKVKQLESWLV